MDFDYSILAKYLTGQISAEELSVIQVWAKSSGQNKRCANVTDQRKF